MSTAFDFDNEVDRREVPALKVHPMVLGEDGAGLFPAGVADMDFPGLRKSPDELTAFLRSTAGWAATHGIAFGEQGAGFARANIACPRRRLSQALGRLSAALS